MTVRQVLDDAIAAGAVPGVIAAVTTLGNDPLVYVKGHDGFGVPLRRDTIVRIASITKPIVTVAALRLLERGEADITDPISHWLPELAGRPVLCAEDAALDDTVPAARAVTIEDVLTGRCGDGMLPRFPMDAPIQVAYAAARLGSDGPPGSYPLPPPAEWLRRLAALPLAAQPGTRWLYQTPNDVLGVLVSRIAGEPLPAVLARQVFGPAGMVDTDFHVPPAKLDRFVPQLARTADGFAVFDPVAGLWAREPQFPMGSSGLVSTLDDLIAFTGALHDGRLISDPMLTAATTDRLTAAQRADAEVFLDGAGWGYGLCVESDGRYGWDGGLGTGWRTDPNTGRTDLLLTQVLWEDPGGPQLLAEFRERAHA
ncbi:serine hydrolase domain-containing protein [Mycobacterium sp. smrl_JER01]|uniref:serine hydrolase domain-containing protein n=1 Tax=Mycobacterium sp. smrl_JER01 TaxID=3402633 RepID=UPI003ABF8BF4